MSVWEYNKENREYTFSIPGTDDYYMVVYKSEADDFVVTCRGVDDPAGGDTDNAPNLRSAKRMAERIVHRGKWKEYHL